MKGNVQMGQYSGWCDDTLFLQCCCSLVISTRKKFYPLHLILGIFFSSYLQYQAPVTLFGGQWRSPVIWMHRKGLRIISREYLRYKVTVGEISVNKTVVKADWVNLSSVTSRTHTFSCFGGVSHSSLGFIISECVCSTGKILSTSGSLLWYRGLT